MTIRCMHISYRKPKATNTHSEYKILIFFPHCTNCCTNDGAHAFHTVNLRLQIHTQNIKYLFFFLHCTNCYTNDGARAFHTVNLRLQIHTQNIKYLFFPPLHQLLHERRCTRISYRKPKATNTHSEHKILIPPIAPIVAWTRLDITSYVHCLSRLLALFLSIQTLPHIKRIY
jgi:hypothetical protein